jgi:predicted nucleic acid-binding protein
MDKSTERINRSIGQRVKKGERDIARRYAVTLNEIRAALSAVYASFEQDGQLTWEEMVKFDRLQRLFNDVDFIMGKAYADLYPIIYEVVGFSYAESHDLTAWAIEQNAGIEQLTASPEAIRAAVEAPIDKLTLNQRLAAQRASVVGTIRQEITLGLVKGASFREMSDRIKPALEGDTTKSWRVVRTETHRVQEGAKHDAVAAADKSGVKMLKTWRTAQDSRVRRRPRDTADHKMLDGVTLPSDGIFKGVKGSGPAPGHLGAAAEDINCRCFLTYSIDKLERVPYNNIETATFDKWRQERRS